jgi:ribosomal protein S18 acetylase RimI-like enzyme
MTIIGLATERAAAGIAKVYVDAWRSTYAALVPHRVLLGMSYQRQTREWSWVIRNRAEAQPVIVAAEANRDVVGFISFGLSRLGDRPAGGRFAGEGDANVGEIYTLYVLPEFQERGIGRRLLSAAFAAMVDKGYGCSFLWVLRDNPSRYFYERVGGQAVAERRERLWGCTLDEICYGWPDLARAVDRSVLARPADASGRRLLRP